MSEFIIYEDTPFAEYLKSIESEEDLVEQPANLALERSDGNSAQILMLERMSQIGATASAILRDFLHTSVPYREELAFEEKFRYRIATSSLLSDSMEIRKTSVVSMSDDDDYTLWSNWKKDAGTSFVTIVSIALCVYKARKTLVDFWLPRTLSNPGVMLPNVTAVIGLGSVAYFSLYRVMRRNAIRSTHTTALKNLRNLVHQSQLLDFKINRAFNTIREIELVSRGYRLSTPPSPISRIEQFSKSRRCLRLRRTLTFLLHDAFAIYECAIHNLSPLLDRANLQKLYDMYNIHPIAALSVEEDSAAASTVTDHEDEETDHTTLENLKRSAQLMHWKRRECLTQLMALGVMTEGQRFDYDKWKQVNTELRKLVDSTRVMVDEVVEALNAELYTPIPDKSDSATLNITDKRLQAFLHRVASLEQHTRSVQAKLYLASEDARALAAPEASIAQETKDKLTSQFTSIAQEFTYMLAEWEDGRAALRHFFEPPSPPPSTPFSGLDAPNELFPSPPESPKPLESPERRLIVLDANPTDSFTLPTPAKAQLFEAVAGQDDDSQTKESSCKKLSRAERIAERKEQLEKEAKAKSAKLDSQQMVHELKDVLVKRRVNMNED
ncbi:Mysoin-binding motif of peroxisomes-domain-containing protein [Endogone sp. FLAS-F59071]|nr:Mysoin-binding motif of peroxisomes-domain-containing protein [Endogone sp. FLAS-F59071]|eukprot:RUS16442.1 Mysoin-binding motif of peroxisomes-domain-containing protein [Endogone sp. FLAS-F59071]